MSSPRKTPAIGAIAFAGVGMTAALLLLIGPPRDRSVPRTQPTSALPSVSAGGVTLTAAAIELPTDDAAFPAGPHRDAVEANCTACHSAAMILSQPPMTREQWAGEVKKMREVYHAPVDDAAVPGIVAYLSGLSEQR